MILSRIFIFIILKVTASVFIYLILERFIFLSPNRDSAGLSLAISKPDKGEQPLIAIAIPALTKNVILSFSTLTSNNSVVNCTSVSFYVVVHKFPLPVVVHKELFGFCFHFVDYLSWTGQRYFVVAIKNVKYGKVSACILV
jgi:hypothetical protein